MKTKYYIGIDPRANNESAGALVTMKKQGMRIVKVMRWYDKHEWFQKIRVKLYLWRMTNRIARYYKNVIILKETNEGIENLNKWAEKPRMFDKNLLTLNQKP